jgi:uncharacterized protein (UPF0332 family)
MEKFDWCIKQKSGIKKIEPNDNLAKEYIKNAEESLRVLDKIKDTKSNMWLATTKYYIEYFAFYALLMKLGIKCEIHDCTIELAKWLGEKGILKKKISGILEKDKELRIENQYYLKNLPVDANISDLRNFVLYMKEIIDKISSAEISETRKNLFK